MTSRTLPSDLPRLRVHGRVRGHARINELRAATPDMSGAPRRPATDIASPAPCASGSTAQRAAAVVEYAVRLAGSVDELAQARRVLTTADCDCVPADFGCIRRVVQDVLHTPDPCAEHGLAMGLTVRRPWASMLLVSAQIGGKNVENRTDSTDYRGPVLIYGGTRIDQAGIELGAQLGMREMAFHCDQQGWLGATVLVDVHRAQGCCAPWGTTPLNPDQRRYHWVFEAPARLAARPWHDNAKGFDGLRPVSWSALVSRKAARYARRQGVSGASR